VVPLRGRFGAQNLLRSRTTLFASFSGKRRMLLAIVGSVLGASPQTPVVPLRGRFGVQSLLRSRTTLFASFSGKRRRLLDQLDRNRLVYSRTTSGENEVIKGTILEDDRA
jgi:hypothetical protein